MTYQEKPDYKRCVSIVNAAGLREMVKPGLLATLAPITTGVIFRIVGFIEEGHFLELKYLQDI